MFGLSPRFPFCRLPAQPGAGIREGDGRRSQWHPFSVVPDFADPTLYRVFVRTLGPSTFTGALHARGKSLEGNVVRVVPLTLSPICTLTGHNYRYN